MATADQLIALWNQSSDLDTRRKSLATFALQQRAVDAPLLDDAVAEELKNRAIQLCQTDTSQALQIAQLILELSTVTSEARHRGYGLWAAAVARSFGYGEYEHALTLYDEAIAIFGEAEDKASQALMQISRIWSLAHLNRHPEVYAAGTQADSVLRAHGRWLPLATLHMNLGIVHSRLGEYTQALAMYEQALHDYEALGKMDAQVESLWARAMHNRAIAFCRLGEFDAAVAASHTALAVQERLGNRIETARVRHDLGVTHLIWGHYNKALKLLDEARTVYMADGSDWHSADIDLDISDCLLRMRRFEEVLQRMQNARQLFEKLKTPHEQGVAHLYSAVAYTGLDQDDKALEALSAAGCAFEQEESAVWVAYANLEKASLLLRQGRFAESVMLAQECAAIFATEDQTVKLAECYLTAARGQMGHGDAEDAYRLALQVGTIGEQKNLPALSYQAHHTLGNLAHQRGDLAATQQEYEQAIEALEQLRGHLMVEYRVQFQEDKQVVYEDMVDLCLELGQAETGLDYAERAKSRALLDLLENRADLRLRVRQEADRAMVEKLQVLRAERDRLHRRWESSGQFSERGGILLKEDDNSRQTVAAVEKEIAELWHALLIRNADYEQDAALWQVQTQPVQPYLDRDTLLLEFFSTHGNLVVFMVTSDNVRAYRLPVELDYIKGLIERFNRQLRAVQRFPASHLPALTRQTQVILQSLHQAVIAPIADALTDFNQLIIVPHSVLHYLPFHALFDGKKYLLEDFAISYLPNASLLRHCRETRSSGTRLLAMGYSANGSLPYVQQEVNAIAQEWEGSTLLEEEATPTRLRELAADYQILHLATHAEMHDQQPLFSGLILEEGWLTTLDIFNLELQASLVTLSACQTGRSVIGGGDELLGLMRAFFYAGTASLALSMWSVEDRSTALLMEHFYARLKAGWSKAAALRDAQLRFIQGTSLSASTDTEKPDVPHDYRHPYFWAPFMLAGDPGPLTPNTSYPIDRIADRISV